MDEVDILIVGSGPAGSTAARYAAEKGLSVKVIERRSEVGVPVRCGEFMPSLAEIQDMFPNLKDGESLFDIPQEYHCLETFGINLVDPNGRETMLEHTGYTVDRDRFDQYLASLAKDSGAEYVMNDSFDRTENGVAVTSKGEVGYKVLIGADGPGSRVARSLGLMKNRNPYPAVTAQVKGDFEPYTQMYFGGIAPGAYGWIIPKDGRANVGVGFSPRFANGNLKDYLEKFMAARGFDEYTDVAGKYVPSEGPIPKTVSGKGMVVGDAAGHVISVNGGGIPLAMIAGRICGRVAADNVLNGTSLNEYEVQWRDVLDKPLRIAANNKKLADFFAFRNDWTTATCMRILGKRRMANLIRCKRIFP